MPIRMGRPLVIRVIHHGCVAHDNRIGIAAPSHAGEVEDTSQGYGSKSLADLPGLAPIQLEKIARPMYHTKYLHPTLTKKVHQSIATKDELA